MFPLAFWSLREHRHYASGELLHYHIQIRGLRAGGVSEVVNFMGNPRVFSRVPVPVPVENPHLPWGYGFCRGYVSSEPQVTRDPYSRRVTRGSLLVCSHTTCSTSRHQTHVN